MRILGERNPLKAKSLGDLVSDTTEWREAAARLIQDGIMAKFSQNEPLARFLSSTDNRVLVECSPTDNFWGAGISLRQATRMQSASWKGKNLMGEILSKVREKIRSANVP